MFMPKKKKQKKKNFILSLKLQTEAYQDDLLHKRFETGRKIYNACLGEALKRYHHLRRSRRYKTLMKELTALNKKNSPTKEHEEKKNQVIDDLNALRQAHRLTEYDLHAYVGPMNQHFGSSMDINTAQKIATRVWEAMEDLIFSSGKSVRFKKFGQVTSLEGKSNKQGIRFRNNQLHWLGLVIPVAIRKKDIYAQEALQGKIKFCRIVKKAVKGKDRFYLQLVIGGLPPTKRTKDGSRKQIYGNSRVGIDPSLQSIAYTSESTVKLQELAPSVESLEKVILRIQRRMDRSRRATNPHKYNADGTVKKANREPWVKSNHYKASHRQLISLNRKLAAIREQEHNQLANHLLTVGTDIFVEETDFKALAKRAKETKVSPKTGKYQRKKRFGKSISLKAPSKFFSILSRKLGYIGKEIHYVNPWTFKASQHNHITDSYDKKTLSNRWNQIGGHKIQRDLYSAFLIMNSNNDLQTTDRQRCINTFNHFITLHDQEISRIEDNKAVKLFASFGIKRTA